MQLKKAGFGNKPKASTPVDKADEDVMFEKGAMGSSNPESLQFSLFYMFGKQFGLRGRDEQRKLRYVEIRLKKDSAGDEYLEYFKRDSKTRDGSKADYRETTPRMFSNDMDEKNPVELYKSYTARRPMEMKNQDSPFYLTPKPKSKLKPDDEIWYYPRPMCANTLGKLIEAAAEECGINHKRLANHSVRKTCVSTLSKSGVPPNKIMQVTGHKNISSIAAYDTALSMDEQKRISKILNQGGSFTAEKNSVSPSSSTIHGNLAAQVPAETASATMSAQDHAFSAAQSLQNNLFKGAFIQTLNLNIQMK